MNHDELVAGINSKLRSLRACDTQATAVAWMAGAYKLMEECLEHLKDKPAQGVSERFVFVPEPPKLQIVHSIPKGGMPEPRNPHQWPGKTPTVVYPNVFLHPGLKPAPKAWTHADTVRLERAVKNKAPLVQRRGR